MPTVNIQGRRVQVGPEFLRLAPDEQNATIDEIATSLGIAPAASVNSAADQLVRMPDGTVVRFPGNMPADQIRSLISGKFPGETAALQNGGSGQMSSAGALQDFRRQYPQYADMSDQQLADALYNRFYNDMPRAEFDRRMGLSEAQPVAPQNPSAPTINVGGRQITLEEYRAMSPEEQDALRAQMPAPIEHPQPNMVQDAIGAGATWLDSALHGVPVLGPAIRGTGDFVASSTISGLTGQPREDVQAQIDQNRQGLAERFPMTATSGAITGAVVPMVAAGGTTAGAQALGLTGPNLASRIVASGATGGIVSGLDTAARSGTPTDIAANTGIGAGFGAVVPGLGALASSIGRGAQGVYNAVRGATGRVDDLAATRVAAARQADQAGGLSLLTQADEATARLNNQPILNMDRGGQTTLSLMRSAANQNPNALGTVTNAVNDRFAQQSQRTSDFFNRIMGGNVSNLERTAQIQAQARAVNSPAYQKAFRAPEAQVVWNSALQSLLHADAIQTAIRQVGARSSNRSALAGLAPNRTVVLAADLDAWLASLPFSIDEEAGQ